MKFHHCSRMRSYLGSELRTALKSERRWKVRQRSNASPTGGKSFAETRCKDKTNTETVIDKRMEPYSGGAKKMDWHWSTKFQWSILLQHVNIHHEFTTTQKLLDEKEMPEFLIVELLKNAGMSYQKIRNIGRKKQDRGSSRRRIGQRTSGQKFLQKVVEIRQGFNIAWNQMIQTPVLSSHSKSFRKSLFRKCSHRSSIARQCTVTKGFHQICLSHRKRKKTFCDLSKARIAPYKNIWKRFQDTVFCCNLMLAQEKGLQFYQTRSHAVILYDTLPAECIEKAICMVTTETLHWKESKRPRVVLRANSRCGLQELPTKGKIILGDAKRCTEFTGDQMQHCGLENSRHINFNSSRAGRTKAT